MEIIVQSRLKEVRIEKNISIRRLADLSGVSKNHISDIENNHKYPTIYTLCLLAAALEVKPEELFEYTVL